MALSDRHIRDLLLACRETHAAEIDCEQFLSLLPAYAESRAEDRALPRGLAGAEEHERLCANCREECRSLIEAIRLELAMHSDRG